MLKDWFFYELKKCRFFSSSWNNSCLYLSFACGSLRVNIFCFYALACRFSSGCIALSFRNTNTFLIFLHILRAFLFMSICSHALPPMRGVRWNAHRKSFFSLLQKVNLFLLFSAFCNVPLDTQHFDGHYARFTFAFFISFQDNEHPASFYAMHLDIAVEMLMSTLANYTLTAQSSAWFGMLKDPFFKRRKHHLFLFPPGRYHCLSMHSEKNLHAFFRPS